MQLVSSAVVFCFAVWLIEITGSSKISGRFDNLDIDEILRSERLIKNYFQCLMGRGPCTPEGSDLKRIIPDALKNGCSECTDIQKHKAVKVIEFLEKNKPEMYKELEAKYDPDGIYRQMFEEKFHLDIEEDEEEEEEEEEQEAEEEEKVQPKM